MGQLSGNSCNIITLLPLGLDCDSVNATTINDTNGIVALYITGGTPPYKVSWDNGSKGTLLTKLSPGDYTAFVTDYYGDFSATTTCTVGFDTFYLEEFQNCETSQKVYYLADLPSTFLSGYTYNLTTQDGCWTSSGTTTYTGQTYYEQFAVADSIPFSSCTECLPEPVPEPVYPEFLCLSYGKKIEGSFTTTSQTTFSSGATINGYPSWTSVTETIYYNTGTTRWEILNWTNPGVPVFVPTTPPPVGTWTILGSKYIAILEEGVCTLPLLSMKVSSTNPTCTTIFDGTITITPIGGTAPYTYSLDGIIYQSSNIFTNLQASTYTAYLKDFFGNVVSQSVVLTAQEVPTNYTITINTINQVNSTFNTTETVTSTFKVSITPTLPATKTVNFVLPINVILIGETTLIEGTSQTNTINIQPNGTSTVSSPTTSPVSVTTTTNPKPCSNITRGESAFTETYLCSITGDGYITGTVTQSITLPKKEKAPACPFSSSIRDSISLNSISLTPIGCSTITYKKIGGTIVYEFGLPKPVTGSSSTGSVSPFTPQVS